MRKQKQIGNAESGRSMVEMLGVLAIMGVLAIGGIAGYRWAMDKYRATDTINELNRQAIVHSTQLMTTQTLNALEFPEETRMGYGVETSLLSGVNAGYFEIALNGVENGVCREILKADRVWPVLKHANGIEYEGDVGICRTDTGVRMAFVFPEDLSGKEGDFRQRCETDEDCRSDCGICEEGYCESQCGDGMTCARTYDNADFYACCTNEKILNGICCPTISGGRCCASMGSCCPSERPLMDKDGNCHKCGEENPVNVTGNTVMCGICDGQEGRTKRELNGNTCVLPCPSETPLMDSSGNCHTCDEYQHISVANSNKCSSVCDGSDDTIHMKRTWLGSYLLCDYSCPEGEVTTSLIPGSPCLPCTNPGRIMTTHRSGVECVAKCDGSTPDRPKRHYVLYSNGQSACVLDECPATHPIQDVYGTCRACTDTSINVNGVKENCFKCPNRALSGDFCIMADKCPKGTHANEDGRCVCDDSTQIQASNGTCYSCDDDRLIDVTGAVENCDMCPNRVAKTFYPNTTKCVKSCADDEFYTSDGCRKCNDPGIFDLYQHGEYCRMCDGTGKRVKRVCVPSACQRCALQCDEGMTMAGNGTCHTCDEVDAFGVDNGMTSSCTEFCAGQRYLVGERCYKCPSDTYSPNSKQCVSCPINKENLTREGDCLACGGTWSGTVCR